MRVGVRLGYNIAGLDSILAPIVGKDGAWIIRRCKAFIAKSAARRDGRALSVPGDAMARDVSRDRVADGILDPYWCISHTVVETMKLSRFDRLHIFASKMDPTVHFLLFQVLYSTISILETAKLTIRVHFTVIFYPGG